MNGKVLSRDFSRSRLHKASCRCKEKRAASFQLSLIVDVSPEICREVSSCTEIAEVFCSSFVGKTAMECEAHISVGREIADKRHGTRFNGEVSAALKSGILDVESIFDSEGNVSVARNLTAFCVEVFGKYDDVFAAENLRVVIAEFLCRDCECAGVVRVARRCDGSGERACIGDGSSMNRRIRFADDLAVIIKGSGSYIFRCIIFCLYADLIAIDSACRIVRELCSANLYCFIRLQKAVIFYICCMDMEVFS